MLTARVEHMLVTSIDTTLKTDVVLTQYIVIISTVRRHTVVKIPKKLAIMEKKIFGTLFEI